MSWLFSQALVEEYSAGNSLDGEPFAQLNVMPTPQAYSSLDKMTDYSRLSQFGMTFAPLMESLGTELLMFYQAGFHAKTYPLGETQCKAEKAKESKVLDQGFGQKWQGLLAKWNQSTFSWRTAQCSLLEDLEQSLEIWPRWGSMRNGECYQQPMLAQNTLEKESGFWHSTPTKTMIIEPEDPSNRIKVMPSGRPVKTSKKGTSGGLSWGQQMLHLGLIPTPNLCEFYQGFPIGWTDLHVLETHNFQQWQQQHSISYAKDWSKAA